MATFPHDEVSRAERLVRVETEIANLNEKMATIQADLREVRDALREMHGGWKTVLAMLAVAGSIGTIISFVWSKLIK